MSNGVRFTLIGAAIAALVCGLVVWNQWHAHFELQGRIMKVRTQKSTDTDTLIVVDARLINPSEYPFTIREIVPSITTMTGEKIDGTMVAGVDAEQVFQAYPSLGQKFNDALKFRDTIAPGQKTDRTIVVTFSAPFEQIDQRKNLTLRLEESRGAVAEFVERAK